MKNKKEPPKGKLVELTVNAKNPKGKAAILKAHGILIPSLSEKLDSLK